jgi:hypothetical protein
MSGDSQIVSELKQLKTLKTEIKRLSLILKDLRSKKTSIEERVLTYLNKSNRQGAKTQDIVVIAKEKINHPTKPKDKKEKDIIEALTKAGVKDTGIVYKDIMNAMKGDEKKIQSLVMKEKK